MSQMLDPLSFPLWGSRLIEASAGTGKTWTIAALYLRLVLGHGEEGQGFGRPLLPAEILVMTFTRAATRELSDRIRARLLEAVACFRGECEPTDGLFQSLLQDYPAGSAREQAAYRLAQAAEMMDDAAVFTIDAWCQRMLREHAFDSGNLFEEELLPDESELLDTAVRDYWREQVYPMHDDVLDILLPLFADPQSLGLACRELMAQELVTPPVREPLAQLLLQQSLLRQQKLLEIKQGWAERAKSMQCWIDEQMALKDKPFDGRRLGKANYSRWLAQLAAWSEDAQQLEPDLKTGWERFTPQGMQSAQRDPVQPVPLPSEFTEFASLQPALKSLPDLKSQLLQHAAVVIAERLQQLKRQARLVGFADMLQRLDLALAGKNGAVLRERILTQYPVALVDEFQDTSPLQYRLFDRLYQTVSNSRQSGLFLIGDPKQSIYGFRGADIHSYLAARRATNGRHYALGANYRSSQALVSAVNSLFEQAESYSAGAFRFRHGGENPLPFVPVSAMGRQDRFVNGQGEVPALSVCLAPEAQDNSRYREFFAQACAEKVVSLLNDEGAGFESAGQRVRLRPADMAILVRTGREAAMVRKALQQRMVASVYLSDKDSVFVSQEAQDLLRCLRAVASPLDGRLVRAALATRTAGLDLAALSSLTQDDQAWEARIEEFKRLRLIWQRQGVLAMLRQLLHGLNLPARLLAQIGGERALTNLLHLAELLQTASLQQEGELALIRWLAEKIANPGGAGDEAIVRLESDADLVKVVTIHKSKGLEYPVVLLPFAASFRAVEKRGRNLYVWSDEQGERQIDYSLSDQARERVDAARLQEDLRLCYVALTRARHALWLGIAPLQDSYKRPCLHHSALGYLLAGGETISEERLASCLSSLQQQGSMTLEAPQQGTTLLQWHKTASPLRDAPVYEGQFDRHWSIASFSSVVRDLPLPPGWLINEPRDPEEALLPSQSLQSAGWHAFPRGPVAGNFLHDQLEWLAKEGFSLSSLAWLPERCQRVGWGNRAEVVSDWLGHLVQTSLPVLGCALTDLTNLLPEMEFWFPADQLACSELDRLCRAHILPGLERASLPERQLHGMLKGFADLVFEHDGKYWVLDYKSNALGESDIAYHRSALQIAMLEHRYDVQAALYLLALHLLLRQRLGARYKPETQLGGAIYLFMRGIAGPEQGCCLIPPPLPLLLTLEQRFWVQAADTYSSASGTRRVESFGRKEGRINKRTCGIQ